jgi:hypothetical protein
MSKFRSREELATIIAKLKALDLSEYPREEAHACMNEIGLMPALLTTLHAGKVIHRARINNNDEVFSSVAQLSFKPPEYNTTYQRASTPTTTMFYGAVLPEDDEESKIKTERIIAASEISHLLREKNAPDGEQTITFSKWRVTQDIPLLTIVHNRHFIEKNKNTLRLYELFRQFSEQHPEIVEQALALSEYFADEFAKPIINQDYDYLISAVFSERTLKQGLAGVYYPSVRTDGDGFNVAISPDFVNTSLELEAVAECTVYRKGKQVIVDNDKFCEVKKGAQAFTLNPITDPALHSGREVIYKILNGEIRI